MPKLEALRQAQLSMLHQTGPAGSDRGFERVDDTIAAGPVRVQPWLWAAWVLSGDPGDLSQVVPVTERVAGYGLPETAPRFLLSPWLLGGSAAVLGFALITFWLVRRNRPAA
jgi:hypothetical protein